MGFRLSFVVLQSVTSTTGGEHDGELLLSLCCYNPVIRSVVVRSYTEAEEEVDTFDPVDPTPDQM